MVFVLRGVAQRAGLIACAPANVIYSTIDIVCAITYCVLFQFSYIFQLF